MAERVQVTEQLLLSISDGEERRQVTAMDGLSLIVMEATSGPVTEAAYGTPRRGHKIMCERAACARVLEAKDAKVMDALQGFFSVPGEPPMLSDLMDRFDVAGERYTYVAWGGNGNAAYRPSGE